jgi:hypothetical protein
MTSAESPDKTGPYDNSEKTPRYFTNGFAGIAEILEDMNTRNNKLSL